MADRHTPLSDLDIETVTQEWMMIIPSGPEDPSGACGCIMPTVLPARSVTLETKKPCSSLRAMPIPVISSFPGPVATPLSTPPLPPFPDMSPPAVGGGGGGGGIPVKYSDLSGPEDTGPTEPDCGLPSSLTYVSNVYLDVSESFASGYDSVGNRLMSFTITLTVEKRIATLCLADPGSESPTTTEKTVSWTETTPEFSTFDIDVCVDGDTVTKTFLTSH